jgi:hypothetical protein
MTLWHQYTHRAMPRLQPKATAKIMTMTLDIIRLRAVLLERIEESHEFFAVAMLEIGKAII